MGARMQNRLAEIQEAIDRFQMDRARELLQEELAENPSAESYFLGSQAAINHGQRIEYLQKALELDPDYQVAIDELAELMPKPKNEIMPAAPVQEPVQQQIKLASVSRRWLAILIDGIIVGMLTFLLIAISDATGIMEGALTARDDALISDAVSQLQSDLLGYNLLVSAIYNVLLMTIFNGQTLGKIILRIRVVKKNGNRFGWLDALLRNVFGYAISGMFMLGYLWALIDRESQAWHDKLAGTVVIDERGQRIQES